MKLATGLTLALATCAGALGAQQKPAAPQDNGAQAILQLEDGWARATMKHDLTYFRQTLAPGFIYSEDDQTYTRAQVLENLAADTVIAAHNEEMEVHAFGSTAVVTGWLVTVRPSPHGLFQWRYRFTDVWMRKAGGWQIVAAHDYVAAQDRVNPGAP